MKTVMKSIGIIALCAQAGTDCFLHIVKEASFQCIKQPRILLECSPLAEYVEAVKQAENGNQCYLVKLIQNSAQSLERAGADLIIIPNNTAHIVFNDLKLSSSVQLMNIIDVVANECAKKPYQSVGLLAPTPIIKKRLYHTQLQNLGISVLQPNANDQELLNKHIMNATQGTVLDQSAKDSIKALANQLLKNHPCQALILACSELAPVFPPIDFKIPLINPFMLLADRALEEAQSLK